MAKEFKMTAENLETYKQELEYLKTVRAIEVAEQIKEARSFGDLSEGRLGERFWAETSLGRAAERSWGTKMAQNVTQEPLKFLKVNGAAFKRYGFKRCHYQSCPRARSVMSCGFSNTTCPQT